MQATLQAEVLPVMPNAVKGLAVFDPGRLFGVYANWDAVWFTDRGVIQHQLPAAHHKIDNECRHSCMHASVLTLS
jgi:hypothetical protein